MRCVSATVPSMPVSIRVGPAGGPLLVALLLSALLGPALQAASPELWADLEPGPHEVGFRAVFLTDENRPYSRRESRSSAPFEGAGRPQRLSIWYPAEATDCDSMRLGELLEIEAPSAVYERWNRMINERSAHLMRIAYGTGPELFARLAQTATAACRDAAIASGPWPWIVYSTGSNSHPADNLVLFEYLASHGFVVISLPQFASRWPRTTMGSISDAVSTDAQLRDLELAVAWARGHLPVDEDRLGLLGFSGGGLYALLLSGKYQGMARAVATLDGSGSYSHAPDYVADPMYFADPTEPLAILDLHKQSSRLDLSRLQSLSGARRVHVRFDDAYHLDFTSLPLYHRLGPELQDYYSPEELDYGVELQRTAAPLVKMFFEAELRGDSTAAATMSAFCTASPSAPISAVTCEGPEPAWSGTRVVLALLEEGAEPFLAGEPGRESELREGLASDDLVGPARAFSTFYLLDEALVVLEAAQRLWPEDAGPVVETALVLRKQGQGCPAVVAFERAAELLRAQGDAEAAGKIEAEGEGVECPSPG